MPYAQTAVFWFVALLVISVAGFWKTYFSVLFQGLDWVHHLHGVAMLAWVLLLINQSWLMRNRKFDLHRKTGKISYILAPLIIISGVVVTYFNVGRFDEPFQPRVMSVFWFGLYLSILFAVLYGLAIYHRNDFQLHARYMITTALVFLVPGLGRIFGNILAPMDIPTLDFYQTTFVPGVIGMTLILADWRLGQIRSPFVVFTSLWIVQLVAWPLLPQVQAWQDFTAWSVAVAG